MGDQEVKKGEKSGEWRAKRDISREKNAGGRPPNFHGEGAGDRLICLPERVLTLSRG